MIVKEHQVARLSGPSLPVWHQGVKATSIPYKHVRQTGDLIRKFADDGAHNPTVRAWAETTTSGVYGKDYRSELAALYYASCDPRVIIYRRDPARVELVKDAETVLKTKVADCDEYDGLLGSAVKATSTIASRASALGNTTIDFAMAGFDRNGFLTHTFTRVTDPLGSGRRIVLDPVAGPLTAQMLRRIVRLVPAGEL